MLWPNPVGDSCRYASKMTGIISAASSSCREPTLEIILYLSGCDRADGLFTSVMNAVAETLGSAAGWRDSSVGLCLVLRCSHPLSWCQFLSSYCNIDLIQIQEKRGSEMTFSQE